MEIEIICKQCGISFSVLSYRKDTAKFCSTSCSNKSRTGEKAANWRGGKRPKNCLRCGKEFLIYPGGNKTYCSMSCAQLATSPRGKDCYMWKGGEVDTACKHCGKTYKVLPYRVGKSEYCSKECFDKVRQNRMELICDQCGKNYSRQKSKGHRNTFNFCSHKCNHEYHIGKNNSAWLGGISFEPYPPTFNPPFKRLIRERDNYTCAVCKGYGNSVHHINYVKEDTTPENCITLCRKCHVRTNSRREYWKKYFSSDIVSMKR